jgi:hypothetical protein
MSSNAQQDAANNATNAQVAAGDKSVAEIQRQFDAVQALMKPYVESGNKALVGYNNLTGLNGADAQTGEINNIQNSPEMAALTKEGEASILANASATGGLRGGNTQGALAQFRPQVLSQLISQRLGQYGTLVGSGQSAAAGQASAGLSTGQSVSNIYGQQGAAIAGGELAQGRAQAGMYSSIGNSISTLGMLKLLKGF